MDEQTKAEWEKSKRIEAEKMKATRSLAQHEEEKANLAYMPITKTHGYSRDPNVIIKNAERMANISIIFTLLGILFGFFGQIFAIEAFAFKLGLAGGGIAMIFGIIQIIGIGVGALTGVVAIVCSIVVFRRATRNLKPAIITASISLILIALYFIIQHYDL